MRPRCWPAASELTGRQRALSTDAAGANIQVNAIARGGALTPPFADYLSLAGDEHYLVGQIISPNGAMIF